MDQTSENTLLQVAERTFEELAFLIPLGDDEAPQQPPGPQTVASIHFRGPFSGTLFIAVPTTMLPELARNMLGLDQDPPRDKQLDAFKELLNVVCGNLLPELAGPQAIFDVSPPQLCPETTLPPTHHDTPPTATATLDLDAGPARLALFIHNDQA